MNCLCCSEKLLRHIGRLGLYWYCPQCRQVMPALPEEDTLMMSCHGKHSQLCDRFSGAKQVWLYIPLKPEQRDIA